MDATQFVERITNAGFTLSAHGDVLRIAPANKLTDPQRQFIKAHKPELLAALAGKAQPKKLLETAKRLTTEIMAAMDTCTFTYDGRALDAGKARAVAFAQLEMADQDELGDFIREARERLAGGHIQENSVPVTVRTPAGNPVTVQARDSAHAEWIRRMNPTPETLATIHASEGPPREPATRVLCAECADHAQGCGHWWNGSPHTCQSFRRKGEPHD